MPFDLFFWLLICFPFNVALLASAFYQVFHFFFNFLLIQYKKRIFFLILILNLTSIYVFPLFGFLGFDVIWLRSWLYKPLWCFISDQLLCGSWVYCSRIILRSLSLHRSLVHVSSHASTCFLPWDAVSTIFEHKLNNVLWCCYICFICIFV